MSFDSNRFDDLIFRHRQSSDFAWALKQWSNPLFDNREQSLKSKSLIQKNSQINSIITPVHYTSLPRTSEQIKSDVLNSLPLKNTIESTNDPKIHMEKAKIILEEMSHRLNLRTVRFLGFIFAKIFNQVFEHIYIDREGIEVLYQFYSLTSTPTSPSSPLTISSTLFTILNTFSRSTSKNCENFTSLPSPLTTKHFLTSPRIVYLPTHRSYMDFILLTYLCYDYNIPMPCIAAAQDFLGLGLLSNLLRHCGAFFIRRSFRSDLLYWTIFDEYVKTHLIHGDYPLEFFIEGARSRTLKTLLPVRQGMLKSCLECYFRRQTDNLILIPLAINYEKVLEDNLHANELLGIPKPKESKSGLLKATQILKKSFGSMIVRFAPPIDVHDVFESFRLENENRNENVEFQRSIPRGVESRFLSQQNGLSHFEQNFLDDLSYRIVNEQQRLTVVFPMALVSFSFLRNSKNRILSVEQIFNEKTTLIDENRRVFDYFSSNFQIFWPNETNRDEFSKRLLNIYSDVFDLTSDNQLRLKMTGDRSNDASLMMKLVMYRNTFLHFLAKPTYILLICKTNSQVNFKDRETKEPEELCKDLTMLYQNFGLSVRLVIFR